VCAKNYQNTMPFDKVIAKIKRVQFFASQCISVWTRLDSVTFDTHWLMLSLAYLGIQETQLSHRDRACYVSLNIALSHLSLLKIIKSGTIWKLRYGLLLAFDSRPTMVLFCISSEKKWDIHRKSWFFIPLA